MPEARRGQSRSDPNLNEPCGGGRPTGRSAGDSATARSNGVAPLPTHIIIPDTQVKPGVRTDHLTWIGTYIAEKFGGRPNIEIIHLGDHWDMPSLSSYDKGKRAMEGRRYSADIEAGNEAFAKLNAPLEALRAKQVRLHETIWHPRKRFLRGNHENRIERAVEDYAAIEGTISVQDCDTLDWEVIPFLQPVWIDGVMYAHFFYNPMTGRPYGGMIETRIKNVGASFTQGHQQGRKYGDLPVLTPQGPRLRHGMIVGSCYLHDEEYMGWQGNAYWRGIVVCYGVEDGSYDPKFVSLDSLCRRYEGVPLTTFMPGIGSGGRASGVSSLTENPSVLNNENGAR